MLGDEVPYDEVRRVWKALITLVGHLEAGSPEAVRPRRDIEQVLADYAQDR